MLTAKGKELLAKAAERRFAARDAVRVAADRLEEVVTARPRTNSGHLSLVVSNARCRATEGDVSAAWNDLHRCGVGFASPDMGSFWRAMADAAAAIMAATDTTNEAIEADVRNGAE